MTTEEVPAERPWRWVIIALIFSGTVINYFDRLALPTLAPFRCFSCQAACGASKSPDSS